MIDFFLNNYNFGDLPKVHSGEKGENPSKKEYENPNMLERQLIKKFRGCLLVLYHYMYWACRHPSEDSTIFVQTLLKKKSHKFVLEYPIHNVKNQTIFHATCFHDNHEMAELLLSTMRDYQDEIDSGSISIFEESLINLNKFEKDCFDSTFRKKMLEYK